MSVHKLMKRVVNDSNNECLASPDEEHLFATYGILTSDPLTLFAIVFTALIHDADHRGVSNKQLSAEEPELAEHYRFKSVAEQNSLDIAWDLLMSGPFDSLRKAIFPTQADLSRFRQVVVNTILATDIFDKEMGDMRKERWNNIFGGKDGIRVGEETANAKNTRATIVLEHIMQASDVSHTMQHWHVYLKWNRRLFEEMSLAFQKGRMEVDPATFWYEGELSFFDNYGKSQR
jgi:3'5'-cyclic nucleotide phosphodiesterase